MVSDEIHHILTFFPARAANRAPTAAPKRAAAPKPKSAGPKGKAKNAAKPQGKAGANGRGGNGGAARSGGVAQGDAPAQAGGVSTGARIFLIPVNHCPTVRGFEFEDFLFAYFGAKLNQENFL